MQRLLSRHALGRWLRAYNRTEAAAAVGQHERAAPGMNGPEWPPKVTGPPWHGRPAGRTHHGIAVKRGGAPWELTIAILAALVIIVLGVLVRAVRDKPTKFRLTLKPRRSAQDGDADQSTCVGVEHLIY